MAYVAVIGLVAIVAFILLVVFLAKRGGPLTVLWALLLPSAATLTLVVLSLASVYYVVPVWAWAAVGACVIGLVVVFVLLGRSVKWKAAPVVAAVALVPVAITLGTLVLLVIPLAPTALLEVRAQQIAEANGFTALLPPDQEMQVSYQPVNALPEPDAGLSIEYVDFLLQERASAGPMTAEDLEALVAPGATPISDRQPLPDDVTTSEQTVQGNPAIWASYVDIPPEAMEKPEEGEPTTLLAFGLEGVEVVLWSTTSFDCASDGECTEIPPLTAEELVAIADTLAPAA
jgi:hypothetical protein